jgi:hypothetical protein
MLPLPLPVFGGVRVRVRVGRGGGVEGHHTECEVYAARVDDYGWIEAFYGRFVREP